MLKDDRNGAQVCACYILAIVHSLQKAVHSSGGSRKSSRVVLLVAKPTPAAKAALPRGGLGACPPRKFSEM